MPKLKRSRQERTCSECGATIAKGEHYAQRTKTITGHESINDGRDWRPYRLSVKKDVCQACACNGEP